MTVHTFVGARGRSLMRSLAALGLIRVLAEQADPDLRCRIEGDDLVIDTDVDDIAGWLVRHYRPRPVLSPWNGGSGFGSKDKNQRAMLDAVISFSDQDRVASLRAGVGTVDRVMSRVAEEGWEKGDLIREISNVCPDEMLPWLRSAVIVLGNDDLAYPPLLGTGGNDGRLDFSSNYHQRLVDVLPTDPTKERVSLQWARDALESTSREKLVKASVGQFDPGTAGTPNTSINGAAQSVVNPWLFVLMVEGCTLFEAAPARRISAQASVERRAAMTFMTRGDGAGFASGNDIEDSRGEVWLPWWTGWLRWPAVKRIFNEGRATWRGKTATRSGDMYLAVGTKGVSTAITEFDRFSIVKRNGLAFTAIRADTVAVANDELLRVVATVEDWPQRLVGRSGLPGNTTEQLRRFMNSRVDVVRAGTSDEKVAELRTLLESLTSLELAVGRSGSLKSEVHARAPRSGADFIRVLAASGLLPELSRDPAFRVGLGFASLRLRRRTARGDDRWVGLRELVLPISTVSKRPEWVEVPEVAGLGIRPFEAVLSDVLTRLMVGDSAPEGDGPGRRTLNGLAMPTSVSVPLTHLHRFAREQSLAVDVSAWTYALLAFDWSEPCRLDDDVPGECVPDPLLGLLGQLRNGVAASLVRHESSQHKGTRDGKGSADLTPSGGADFDEPSLGLTAEIVGALVSSKSGRAAELAADRVRQAGCHAAEVITVSQPLRIAAALLPRASHRKYASQFIVVPKSDLEGYTHE